MKTANKARPDAHWLCELCQLCVMLADLSIFVMPMLQFFNLPECCFDELEAAEPRTHTDTDELVEPYGLGYSRCDTKHQTGCQDLTVFMSASATSPFPVHICPPCANQVLSTHDIWLQLAPASRLQRKVVILSQNKLKRLERSSPKRLEPREVLDSGN